MDILIILIFLIMPMALVIGFALQQIKFFDESIEAQRKLAQSIQKQKGSK